MGDIRLIEVKEEILSDNIKQAEEVRERLRRTKTMLLNLMSSPGSGKTMAAARFAGKCSTRQNCPFSHGTASRPRWVLLAFGLLLTLFDRISCLGAQQ